MVQDQNKGASQDGELLQQYMQSLDNALLGELYARYIPLIYGVCLKYLGSVDDASDAVMDIFEHLASKIAKYNIDEFRPWIYTVAKNHCLQKLRHVNKEIPVDASSGIMEYISIVHLLEDKGSREDEFRHLERCMDKLPEKQRECVQKFFYDNKSYADIVAETMYPLNGVKSYLQNAKRNLKICMEGSGDETN